MKRLLILSGKGGTGKTTTAAAFLHFAKARAMADCDVDAPNLHLLLSRKEEPETSVFYGGDKAVIDPEKCAGCGLCQEHCRFHAIRAGKSGFEVDEFACEGCGVCQYICPAGAVQLHEDAAGTKRLYAGDTVFSTAELKMGRGNSGKLVSEVKLAMLKNAPECELAIVDGSPGIGCPVIASVSGMDLVLIVAEPSASGVSDLKRLLETAETFHTKVAVCVNKYDLSPAHAEEIEAFCRAQKVPFVGKIPYDKTASQAINAGKSLAEISCPAGKALKKIFEQTMGLLEIKI